MPDGVAIVGSGIVGTTVAHLLTRHGHDVTMFEKGPDYPYPHQELFAESLFYLHDSERYRMPRDLKDLSFSGDYGHNPDLERVMVVGGMATQWEAIALRMGPKDFRTRSLFGYGTDWPIAYDELEPFYCRAESLLGVSGTDADNPFAPQRSHAYPLPPFALSWDDARLAARLLEKGIRLHTTPQARTRQDYDGRPGCANFGLCELCPIGARYSPNHHLKQALATGRLKLMTGATVRRVALDRSGRASSIVFRRNDAPQDEEYSARVVVVAGGAIESARLLLLSRDARHPDGLGNASGHVGAGLTFQHIFRGSLQFEERLYPGRFGGWTGQSHQFLDAPTRGHHAAVKVEFTSQPEAFRLLPKRRSLDRKGKGEILEALEPMLHSRAIGMHAESVASPDKRVTLSATSKDRFDDPFAHVHYDCADLDRATFRFARTIFDSFASATRAKDARFAPTETDFDSGSHHLGTCRMSRDSSQGVVDSLGRVHDVPGLLVLGGSTFVGSSGGVNPTLTMVALAIRSAEALAEQLR
jgi:choline dehydrogenase-like flavoprotein